MNQHNFHQFFLENLKDRAEVGAEERQLAKFAQEALVLPLQSPEAYGEDATMDKVLATHSNAFMVELHEDSETEFFASIYRGIESYTGQPLGPFDVVTFRLDLLTWILSINVQADKIYTILIRLQDLENQGWLYDELVKSGLMTEENFTAKVSTFYFSNAVQVVLRKPAAG